MVKLEAMSDVHISQELNLCACIRYVIVTQNNSCGVVGVLCLFLLFTTLFVGRSRPSGLYGERNPTLRLGKRTRW